MISKQLQMAGYIMIIGSRRIIKHCRSSPGALQKREGLTPPAVRTGKDKFVPIAAVRTFAYGFAISRAYSV